MVTGQPGAGKSAVLARAALSVEAEHGGPGLAFHARAATIGDFLAALADLTGVDTPASADELVTSLADLPGRPPARVVLDALDEAASDLDRRQITEALAELAVLPWLRVAVATRTLAAGNPLCAGTGCCPPWRDRTATIAISSTSTATPTSTWMACASSPPRCSPRTGWTTGPARRRLDPVPRPARGT